MGEFSMGANIVGAYTQSGGLPEGYPVFYNAMDIKSSSAGEFHTHALTEPDVR